MEPSSLCGGPCPGTTPSTPTVKNFHAVPLRPDFQLDEAAMLAAIESLRPALLCLSHPNNPTGTLWDEAAMARLIEAQGRAGGIAVIDEAYQPFAARTWNIDGLPTVVLEAMALGTPVVATSVSGLPEVVRDGLTGILIEPGDVAALTRSLAELAAGQVPVVTLARNARALIEEQFNSRRQAATLSTWEEGNR